MARLTRLTRGAASAVILALLAAAPAYVIDGTTYATLAISIEGSYTDICAAIS